MVGVKKVLSVQEPPCRDPYASAMLQLLSLPASSRSEVVESTVAPESLAVTTTTYTPKSTVVNRLSLGTVNLTVPALKVSGGSRSRRCWLGSLLVSEVQMATSKARDPVDCSSMLETVWVPRERNEVEEFPPRFPAVQDAWPRLLTSVMPPGSTLRASVGLPMPSVDRAETR